MPAQTHHRARVNGVWLHDRLAGGGEPVVLLHGWAQTGHEWRHVAPGLVERCGHWVPEERPDYLLEKLPAHFAAAG